MALQTIKNPAVPNLPLSPTQFESRYFEQFNNVLRLYFNQLNTATGVQASNTEYIQTEIDALTLSSQQNQTLIWLNM
jgi:hypothetical protein